MARGDDLTRDDLIRGLNAVIARLRADHERAGIYIVGGAALALRYFDRGTTADIDARIRPSGPTLKAARQFAEEHGWPIGWLNNKAATYIPTYAKEPTWETLYDDGSVSVAVASAEALLAMKLHAGRKGRDDDDIAQLLALCSVRSVAAAESLYEEYYLGETLRGSALAILTTILAQGIPPVPAEVDRPMLGAT